MKKTRLIPFDWTTYLSNAAKPVFRNSKYKLLFVFNSKLEESYPLTAICTRDDKTSEAIYLTKNGMYGIGSSGFDLLLEEEYEEPEKKTFWVNIYNIGVR